MVMTNASQHFRAGSSEIRAALVGSGIGLSRTPGMHQTVGHVLGLNYSYEIMDVDTAQYCNFSLTQLIERCESLGYAGLNITYPFKQEVLPLLDELSDNAKMLAAVNTVVFKQGRRFGYNTDYSGFVKAFEQQMSDVVIDRVLLLGAGGAGSAAAFAVAGSSPKSVFIYDRNPEKAAQLAVKLNIYYPNLNVEFYDCLTEAIAAKPNGIINASPMGMQAYPGSAFPQGEWRQSLWAADLVYLPLQTQFLSDAETAGCKTMSGAHLAIHQAVDSFALITGQLADAKHFSKAFAAFNKD